MPADRDAILAALRDELKNLPCRCNYVDENVAIGRSFVCPDHLDALADAVLAAVQPPPGVALMPVLNLPPADPAIEAALDRALAERQAHGLRRPLGKLPCGHPAAAATCADNPPHAGSTWTCAWCEEVAVADKIIVECNRLLDALPCEKHGRCVPHALEEVQRMRVALAAAQARAERLATLIGERRTHSQCADLAPDEICDPGSCSDKPWKISDDERVACMVERAFLAATPTEALDAVLAEARRKARADALREAARSVDSRAKHRAAVAHHDPERSPISACPDCETWADAAAKLRCMADAAEAGR